jgi:hypothetical protein
MGSIAATLDVAPSVHKWSGSITLSSNSPRMRMRASERSSEA